MTIWQILMRAPRPQRESRRVNRSRLSNARRRLRGSSRLGTRVGRLERLERRDLLDATIWSQFGQLVVVRDDAVVPAAEIAIERDGVPVATGDQLVISYNVAPPGSFDFRESLVVDTNGFARVKHVDGSEPEGSEDPFGTSFKLPPGLILNDGLGGQHHFLSARIDSINLLTDAAAQGALKLVLRGRPADAGSAEPHQVAPLDVEWTLTLLPPTDGRTTVLLDVDATAAAPLELSSAAMSNAEAFRVLEYSSSNVPDTHTSLGERTHDADQLRVTDARGVELAPPLDLNAVPANQLFFAGGLATDGWLELNQLQPAPLNNDPPNLRARVLPGGDDAEYRAQGFLSLDAGTDENSDNLGAWINRTFTSPHIAAGSTFRWRVSVVATDRVTLGLPDVVARTFGGNLLVGVNEGDHLQNQLLGNIAGLPLIWAMEGDFNGDAINDLAILHSTTGQWTLTTGDAAYRVSDGPGFTTRPFGIWSPPAAWEVVVAGDFNGDGLTDVAGRDTSTKIWWVGLSRGYSLHTTPWGAQPAGTNLSHIHAADIDGDGRDDLVGRDHNTGTWWRGRATDQGFDFTPWSSWSNDVIWHDIQVADVNGDGRADLIGRVNERGEWWATISTPTGPEVRFLAHWSTLVSWTNIRVIDSDGDGRHEIIGRTTTTGEWWRTTILSQGIRTEFVGRWHPGASWDPVVVIDMNGDGRDDIVGRSRVTGEWWVARALGAAFTNEFWGTTDPRLPIGSFYIGDFAGNALSQPSAGAARAGVGL